MWSDSRSVLNERPTGTACEWEVGAEKEADWLAGVREEPARSADPAVQSCSITTGMTLDTLSGSSSQK